MEKDGSILISGDTVLKGMQDSPYLKGCHKIVNLDIHTKPGIVRIAPKLSKESSTTVTGLIQWATLASNGEVYGVDDQSSSTSIYKRATNGTWSTVSSFTSATSRGIIFFNDYIFRVYSSGGNLRLDRYGVISGTPSVSANWVTLATGSGDSNVPTFVGSKDTAYFGVGNKVYSLADATVATIGASTLDIPADENITCFTEIGQYLMIGTDQGNIYPWDQVSSSFSFPIKTGRNYITSITAKDNLIYINTGTVGDVLVGNLSQVEFIHRLSNFTEVPDLTLNATSQPFLGITPWGEYLLAGVSRTNDGSTNGGHGVYVYKDKAWSQFTTSNGYLNDSNGVQLGIILSISPSVFIVSWRTGSTFGVDVYDKDKRTTSYGAYLESQMYVIGGDLLEKGFQNLEFQLAKDLGTSQGIKFEYRTDTSDSYTEIETFAYGTGTGADNDNLGAINKKHFTPKIPPCSQIQIKVSLTASGSNDTTPELVYVKLW